MELATIDWSHDQSIIIVVKDFFADFSINSQPIVMKLKQTLCSRDAATINF